MKFLSVYVKKYWKPFAIAVLFLLFEVLCDLMQPTIMASIIDVGVKQKNTTFILQMGGLMILITAFGAGLAIVRNIISSVVSQKFGRDLRSDLFRKIQSLSFDNLDKFENASLITRLTGDVTQMQNFVMGLMRIFVRAPLLAIGSVIMAVALNPTMSLVLVAVVPLVIIVIAISLKKGFPYFIKVQQSLDRLNGVTREYLTGVRVVKAFNRFEYETQRFEDANENQAQVSMKAMRLMAVFFPIVSLIVNLGIVAVIWFGGNIVHTGGMEAGQIIAFINYITQLLFSLMMISFVFITFVRAKASAERIGEVFTEENIMKTPEPAATDFSQPGKIDFENVTFAYRTSSGEPAIRDISFGCLPGETVGIIGSTGSGKSSLVGLLPRFYDSTGGRVKVDGVDVSTAYPQELRKRIALVPQKVMLFTGTILDNIRWGKQDASMEEIEFAAKTAQAEEFIRKLPEGYESVLGQGGVNLSGGQKQRLSIARALVKKPEILILDDCTSAVDVNTEDKIRESLKTYSKDLTTIVIAQRITSVIHADRIVVMDNGSISGIGTHEELMKSSAVYQDIFRSQIGKEEKINGGK